MKLCYNVTLTESKKTVGVYDEHTAGGIYSFYVGPFEDYDEASEYAEEWTDEWRHGYSGRASTQLMEGDKYFVRCSRWTSCD